MRSICLFAALLFSFSPYAIDVPPHLTESAERIRYIDSIVKTVEVRGHKLRDDSDLAISLVTQEKQEGRNFSDEEIRAAALEAIRSRPRCFTANMRVLTERGYTAIQDLQAGDSVLSWDEAKRKLVPNTIREKVITEDWEYFSLLKLSAVHQPLQITADHPVYAPDAQRYLPISVLKDEDKILHIDNSGPDCEAQLVARGPLESAGKGTVMTLKLKRPPNNFIVEGVVVHNKPIHHL